MTHKGVVMPVSDYVAGYRDIGRFIALCQQCQRYGKAWSCPPFDYDVEHCLDGYTQVLLVGTQVAAPCADLMPAARQAGAMAWDRLMPFYYGLERRYPGARCCTVSCRLCGDEPCSRAAGQPCRHPQLARPSLESIGFDMGKTAQLLGLDMQWSHDGTAPSHFTFITGLFSPQPLPAVEEIMAPLG